MKKIFTISAITLCTITSANAGWFSDLFSKKAAEPQTLQEACDLEKIKSICPEIILGQKTLLECLTDNIKTVSSTCVNYVKKSVSENSAEVTEFTNQIKSVAAEKTDAATTKETIKTTVSEKVDAAKLELAKKLIASANEQ